MNQHRLALRLSLLALAAVVIPACGDDDDDAVIPSAVASAFRILCKGGAGTYGGMGGYVTFINSNGTDTMILRTGTVNATVNPNVVKPNLGGNPLTISTDTTLTPDLTGNLIGDDTINPATGLWVKPGAVLTLDPQIDGDGFPFTLEQVYLSLQDAVYLEGTIRVGRKTGTDHGADLSFGSNLEYFVVTSSGQIDTHGTDFGPGTDGGNGGYVSIETYGTIINAGRIDTTGGNGDNGGAGGFIYLYSYYYGIYNSGTLISSGGIGNAGNGGIAGYIDLGSGGGSNYGPMANSGSITSRGGDGTDRGGDGGSVDLQTDYTGAVTSSGPIDSSGGDCLTQGNGGNGGPVSMSAYNGSIRISGPVTTAGGDSLGDFNFGGAGAQLYLYQENGGGGSGELGGGIFVGADLTLTGGSGYYAGQGGPLYVSANEQDYINPTKDQIMFVGYSEIHAGGGAGTEGGGSGSAYVSMTNGAAYDGNDDYWLGSIILEPDWHLQGGDSTNGYGGYGYGLDLYIEGPYYPFYNPATFPPYNQTILVTGFVDARGGHGATYGGGGGYSNVYSPFNIEFRSWISCAGGNSPLDPGYGGTLYCWAGDSLFLLGGANLNAGSNDDLYSTDSGGYADLYGRWTKIAGGVSARGSNNSGGDGGNGGQIYIRATESASILSGLFSSKGGTGMINGSDGTLWIDGIRVDGAEASFP